MSGLSRVLREPSPDSRRQRTRRKAADETARSFKCDKDVKAIGESGSAVELAKKP
jgi:hypothetical protein